MRSKDPKSITSDLKIALVHDYLIRFGGAERVLLEMAKIFNQAPIYTLLYNKKKMAEWFDPARIRPSFLQKFPKFLRKRYRYLLPLLPIAPETFDLREFDLVISSCSAFVKGIISRSRTIHICYCHNPARFLWDIQDEYLKKNKLSGLKKILGKVLFHYLRLWDKSSSRRVDEFIANSKSTAERIWKYYRRRAKVIYPPVSPQLLSFDQAPDLSRGRVEKPGSNVLDSSDLSRTRSNSNREQNRARSDNKMGENYFLIVSQLSSYKNIDIAVEAFNKLELPLVIIGEGPQQRYLKKIAKKNIEIIGWQPDEVLARYYKNCLALVFPAEEDFGLAPVEAMICGKPVLALRRGGATETIVEGMTGEFFDDPLPEILADGVRRLRENLSKYSPLLIKKRAEKFSQERFRSEFLDFVEKACYYRNK